MKNAMMVLLSALTFAMGTTASAMLNTTKMTCSQAEQTVAKAGAVTLGVGAEGLYDRFVWSSSECFGAEKSLARAYVTTLDSQDCWIGYVCVDRDNTSPKYYAATYSKCKEGNIAISREEDVNGHTINVNTICTNGVYRPFDWVNGKPVLRPLPAPVTPRVCKDGELWDSREDDVHGHEVIVHRVCSNGIFKKFQWVNGKIVITDDGK